MCLEHHEVTATQCALAEGPIGGYMSTDPDVCAVIKFSCEGQASVGVDSACGCGCCPAEVVIDCEPGADDVPCDAKRAATQAVCPASAVVIAG